MMMKSTITRSCDISESVYEDPDAPLPDVTDGGQSVFNVRNVPHPWFRTRSMSLCNNSNTIADPADTTRAGSSQLSGYPPDYKKVRPVRPPPRPPLHSHKSMTSSSPTGDGGNLYMTSISEANPPAVGTEGVYSPTRPERPPLPSSCSSRCSTLRLKPESCTDESQQSYINSMQQPPVSPAVSEVNSCGTYSTAIDNKSSIDEGQHTKCSTQQPPVSPAGSKEQVNIYGTSSTMPPAVDSERLHSPTRPERPPLPSNYSRCSIMRLKSESCTDESQQSSCSYISSMQQPPVPPAVPKEQRCTDERQQSDISSMQQPPVSPAVSEVNICKNYGAVNHKIAADDGQHSTCSMQQPQVSPTAAKELNVCGTYRTVNKSPDIPELPPRHGKSSSPKTITPPPPPFTPPPPPSTGHPLDTMYRELEHRPYLDVLPEDVEKMTQEKPTIRYHTGSRTLTPQQSTEDTEDINGMLRWLKRVSKSDSLDPSVYGLCIQEEIRSFSQRAMNVRKALRLYNLLMMKRNESLRNIITEFTSISDSLDKLKKMGKTMEIAGGTTGAVGGVTAVLGIAFAPMSLGTSLIATAIGAGMVASAGGIGAHSAKANKKIVNRMAVEKLVYEYKGNIVDLENCLSFILSGMNELRMHDIARLQRAGALPEVLKVAHLSQTVLKNTMSKDSRTTIAHMGGMPSERLILAFVKDMDHYFTEKDGLKLKKSSKSKFSVRVRLLAENLQDELYHLNHMWEMFG